MWRIFTIDSLTLVLRDRNHTSQKQIVPNNNAADGKKKEKKFKAKKKKKIGSPYPLRVGHHFNCPSYCWISKLTYICTCKSEKCTYKFIREIFHSITELLIRIKDQRCQLLNKGSLISIRELLLNWYQIENCCYMHSCLVNCHAVVFYVSGCGCHTSLSNLCPFLGITQIWLGTSRRNACINVSLEFIFYIVM